jgi:hypothetical protein
MNNLKTKYINKTNTKGVNESRINVSSELKLGLEKIKFEVSKAKSFLLKEDN